MYSKHVVSDALARCKRSHLHSAAALLFGLVSLPTIASVISVTSCSESALRTAVDSAVSTSHIDMTQLSPDCKITLTSVIPITQTSLYFYGPVGSPLVTISGGDQVQVFNHTGTGIVAFTQLAVVEGNVTGSAITTGGCISSNGTAALVRSQITGCAATAAGNQARGGAVYAKNAIALNSSVVANSKAVVSSKGNPEGGGLWTRNLTMNYSTVTGNSVIAPVSFVTSGGGIYLSSGGTSLITNSTVDNNTALDGGGIFSDGATTIINSTISSNEALSKGGGMFFYGANTAPLTIANSTIASNAAAGGGGLYLIEAAVSINSSIFANATTSGKGDDVYCDEEQHPSLTLTGSNNLMGGSTLKNCAAGLTYNIDDPQLTPLGNHGGLTRIHALLATSPAIGGGLLPAAYRLTYDQRGVGYRRIYSQFGGGAPDIGAYERQGATDDEIFYSGFETDLPTV